MPNGSPARLIVMVSGNGTNLQAILNAIEARMLDANVMLVVSNRKAAYGLTRAEHAGVPTLYFPLKPFAEVGREAYDQDLAKRLEVYQPDLIVLAGWMHVFSPAFLDVFPRKVINLHPALPGAFPGIDAIERTFEAYQRGEIRGGGCMVHYVIPEVDAGAVIAQVSVPILPHDVIETFEARMHEAEHHLLIEAIRKVTSN